MQPDQEKRVFIIVEDITVKMSIYFDHLGKKMSGNISYTNQNTKDCIIMQFDNKFYDDIVFSKIYGAWTSVSDMQSRYPLTYKSIQMSLTDYFEKTKVL